MEDEAKILPKGFVVNSDQIGGSIERIATEPVGLEDIAKLWKVYTTTKRRLLDPTAERLENYWWRIWGSRRRLLDAATVAHLFAEISHGQTFVPLRGPPNRDEGSPPSKAQLVIEASSTTGLQRPPPRPIRNNTNSSSNLSRPPTVMPHPILKKTRGPSNTGPRPTARFVSPHESEQETEPVSSGSNSHVVVQPPSPVGVEEMKADKKSSATTRKKPAFVATKKKRPVMPRRQSSQTSGVSQVSNTSSAAGSPSSMQSPAQRTLTDLGLARGKKAAPSRFQENFSPVYRPPAANSGSRGPAGSRSEESKLSSPKKSANKEQKVRYEDSMVEESIPAISNTSSSSSLGQKPRGESQSNGTRESKRESIEKPCKSSSQNAPPPLARTLSESYRSHLSEHRLGNREGNKSSASIAPTLMAVTAGGQLASGTSMPSEQAGNQRSSPSAREKGKGRATGEYRQEDVFSKRPVQGVSGSTASEYSGSLARSKSQLTLLLEKDRARNEGKRSEGKKSPNGKRRS